MEIDDFERELMKSLSQYSTSVTQAHKKAVRKTANEAKKIIEESISFQEKSGNYRKSIGIKKAFENDSELRVQVGAVKNGQYRLTHLLEYGHALRRGGRTLGETGKFPHMQQAEEMVQKSLNDNIKKEVEKIK